MYVSLPKNYSGNAFRQDGSPLNASSVLSAGSPERFSESRPKQMTNYPPMRGTQQKQARQIPLTEPITKVPKPAPIEPPTSEPCRDKEERCDGKEDKCGPMLDCDGKKAPADCRDCRGDGKNPLACLFEALRGGKKSGLQSEDFLLICLIVLMMGKEGNEDLILILAMLLLA